jgi:hypothetical protein
MLAPYLVAAEKQGAMEGCAARRRTICPGARGGGMSLLPEISLTISAELIKFAVERAPNWNPINCGYHEIGERRGPGRNRLRVR